MTGEGVSRRALVGAGTVATAGVMARAASAQPARPALARGAGARPQDRLSVRQDGTYDVAPLAKDGVGLGVVQSRVIPVDADNPAKKLRSNLEHMRSLIDFAQGWGGPKDILFFHEFPLTGYYSWDRKQALRVAIDIPGPETQSLGEKARQYNCWLVFGSYARDPAWPGHLLSITTVMDPRGEIVAKIWKARNIKGVFKGFELFTTTVFDVLDRYVEMYGRDAVIPVIRTNLGNLAVSSVQREPELFRAMALKGAEIILRTASGGFTKADVQASAMYNGVYVAVCNNSVSPDNGYFFEDAGGSGGSTIYGPEGEVLDTANSPNETLVSARIPIAAFRARHRQPILHKELYLDVYEAYRDNYPPNLFSSYVPSDGQDAARYLKDKGRWR